AAADAAVARGAARSAAVTARRAGRDVVERARAGLADPQALAPRPAPRCRGQGSPWSRRRQRGAPMSAHDVRRARDEAEAGPWTRARVISALATARAELLDAITGLTP